MSTLTSSELEYISFRLNSIQLPQLQDVGGKRDAGEPHSDWLQRHFDNVADSLHRIQSELAPVDDIIQSFIDSTFSDQENVDQLKLPRNTFELDQTGLAEALSLPMGCNEFKSALVESYRTLQGVLHNTRHDRRTTQGVFHVAEGGLPISNDKREMPKNAFAKLLERALTAPDEDAVLPLTAGRENISAMVSLLLKPTIIPAVPGVHQAKKTSIRFFAPGGLVSNLHFVESVFGNAGSPYIVENDPAFNFTEDAGVYGVVILAPHLNRVTKKELGLPSMDRATERQKQHNMAWQDADELYNGGEAFKATFRDEKGVVITIIADNYFGYCKKEVKTQLSYAANMLGAVEEEHAGGALAFPGYNLGKDFAESEFICLPDTYCFDEAISLLGDTVEVKKSGYAVDKQYSDLVYLPENAKISVDKLTIRWTQKKKKKELPLNPGYTYVHPSGYKVHLEKNQTTNVWYLVGTVAEGTFCHKPATVSGGGKSEISKPINEIIVFKNFYVGDLDKDMALADQIIKKDYSKRFKDEALDVTEQSRHLLSKKRSLGSVIKLLTSNEKYTDEYNEWLSRMPAHVKSFVYVIKRFYEPQWGDDWQAHFSVDDHDGMPGHELKFDHNPLPVRYLRVSLGQNRKWNTFRLRQDFYPASKVQMEDDISVSIVYPHQRLPGMNEKLNPNKSYKIIHNCEKMLFQRPDDAIHRGADPMTETDFSGSHLFASNYAPLKADDARDFKQDVIRFDSFTPVMQRTIKRACKLADDKYFVCTTHPRIVDGNPTKNVRYLQKRPDLANPRAKYVADIGTRLNRKLSVTEPVQYPVNSVLVGRRNNPADRERGIAALSVYNPIHYQELPELMMDFMASLSGKSPSTTGFGSEGALTKGPFNMLRLITDLNNALVSYILTEDAVFSTAAGFIGPNTQVDHDITFLAPEIWARLEPHEREPGFLIEHHYLEKLEDFTLQGRTVEASRLGYRINRKFAQTFFGRIFALPEKVMSDEMLQPELQNQEDFATGVEHIVNCQNEVARAYFLDGSVEIACPPLKALLHIMVEGNYQGMTLASAEFRQQFSRESMLTSDWYQDRLRSQQQKDIEICKAHIKMIEERMAGGAEGLAANTLADNLEQARERLMQLSSDAYCEQLMGTIGRDPGLGHAG